MRTLSLTNEQLQQMISHVDAHLPLESCGLLAGKNSQVEKIFFVQNQAQSPVRYVMDPIQQLHAFEWIESNNMDLLGIFHSHPAGPETVSPTDIAEAAYDVVYIILARVDGEFGAPAAFGFKTAVTRMSPCKLTSLATKHRVACFICTNLFVKIHGKINSWRSLNANRL
jgi:[CysO sulfur-carrier protein]-S-L-cysteine hydrolase